MPTTDNAYQQLVLYLKDHKKDSGIIYCHSQKSTDNLAYKLQDEGFSALPYHAGMDSDLRTLTQNKFIKDDVLIIVATIAFGMGIDKPNIRFVIHYDLPKNLETYYQETGRAGRDGEKSDCILFYSHGDKIKTEYFIKQKEEETEKKIAHQKLRNMINFSESRKCRRKILLNYFGEEYNKTNCGNCDNCLEPKETIDGTLIAKKVISCVSQVNERFGMTHIVDVLRGSKNQKVIRYHHDILRAYGAGKEYSKKQWKAIIRELIREGFLESQDERYPIVKLTQKSYKVLEGKENILLTKPIKEYRITPEYFDEKFDWNLFEILRSLRKELADIENMPPYIIFHDSSLKEMATYFPQSLIDFQKISGVGDSKLEKYGGLFLKEIIDYCEKHEHISSFSINEKVISEKSKAYSVKEIQKKHPQAYQPWTKEDDEKLIVGYKSGRTIEELMELFQRQRGGINSRLKKLGLI